MSGNNGVTNFITTIGVAGVISLLGTYFFLGGVGVMVINDRVDERIHELDTADRIFVLNQTPPGLRIRPIGNAFSYQIIEDTTGHAVAIHVTFRHGDSVYSAEIESEWHEKIVTTFSRGESPSLVTLGKTKAEGSPSTRTRVENY